MSTEAVLTPPGTGPGVVPQTHPKGFFFLFAGEFAERFSFYGMRAILPLYLSDQLGFGQAKSGLYYSLFLALCYLLPMVGGYIADKWFGKYWTIVGFSLPYVAGQLMVGIENPYFLFGALALLAMGTGVIKPNISTLMGITYDQQRPGQDKLRSNAFQYFYMSINIGAALSQVSVPLVRDTTGSYLYAFLVPAAFMVIALALFAAGKPYYGKENVKARPPETPEETVTKLKVLSQVALLFLLVTFFWAVFDQSSSTWVFFAKTYMDTNILGFDIPPDSIQALNPIFIVMFIGGALLVRTCWPKNPGAPEKPGMAPTSKMMIGFLLTSLCMGVMAVAGYQTGTPEKAAMIQCPEGKIFIPLGSLNLTSAKIEFAGEGKFENQGGSMSFPDNSEMKLSFEKYTSANGEAIKFRNGVLTLTDGKKLYFKDGRIDMEKSRDLFGNGVLKFPGALDLDFTANKSYQLPDGTLVIKRGNIAEVEPGKILPVSKSEDKPSITIQTGDKVKYVKPENRIGVWWMALAFLVITVAEILISVTGLELAFVVAPQSMKGFITACWLLTVFIANFFINAPIADLYPTMNPGNYFLLLTCAGLLVAILFIPVSRRFNRAMELSKAEAASIEGNTEAV